LFYILFIAQSAPRSKAIGKEVLSLGYTIFIDNSMAIPLQIRQKKDQCVLNPEHGGGQTNTGAPLVIFLLV
jgi:hypothetical protein